MAIRIAQLIGLITADNRDFERKMAQSEQTAKTKARGIQSALDRIKGVSASVNIGGGGGLFGGRGASDMLAKGGLVVDTLKGVFNVLTSIQQAGLQYHRTIQNAGIGFEVLGGSAAKAQQHIADLQNKALKLPFELTDLVKASGTLQAFGFTAGQVEKDITAIGDAASVASTFNGDFAGSLQGITLALGQMRSAGKLSLEEINQLTERGIPALDILSRKTGKSIQQIRKDIEGGRVSGKGAAELLTRGFREAYGGLSEKLMQTTSGKESNLSDAYAKFAYENVKNGTVKGYDAAIDEITKKLGSADFLKAAQKIDATTAGGINSVMEAAKGNQLDDLKNIFRIIGEDVSAGFKTGVGDTSDWIKKKFQEGVDAVRNVWDTHSDSKVTLQMGFDVASGFANGLLSGQGLIDNALNQTIYKGVEAGKGSRRVLPLPDRAQANLDKLLREEPTFVKKLEEVANKLQTKPEWLLQLMALETAGSYNKSIRGGAGNGYVGLIQFGQGARKDVGLPTGTADAQKYLESISATEQLDYVYKYLKQRQGKGNYDSLAKLYAAVGAGHFVSDDNTVMFREEGFQAGDDKSNQKISASGFRANAPWNTNKDSVIQQWEFGTAAANALRLSDAMAALGQTVTRLNQGLAPQLTMAERRALHNPGSAEVIAPEGGQFIPNPVRRTRQIAPGSSSVNVVANLEKIPLAIDTLGSAAQLNFKKLIPLPPALQQMATGTEAVGNALDKVTKDGDALQLYAQQIDHVANLQQAFTQDFEQLIQGLTSGSESAMDTIKNFARSFITNMLNEIQSAIISNATGGKYSSLAGMLGGVVSGAVGKIFNRGGNAGAVTTDPAKEAAKQITDAVTNQSGKIADTVKKQTETLSVPLNKTVEQSSQSLAQLTDLANCSCAPTPQEPLWKALLKGAINGAVSGAAGGVAGKFGGGGSSAGSGTITAVDINERPRIVGARANGGDVKAGSSYIWNEPGAEGEWFIPSHDGFILNRRDAMTALSNSAPQQRGGNNITINFHVTAPNGQITRESQQQAAARMAAVLRQADGRSS